MTGMSDDDNGTYYEDDQPVEHIREVMRRPPDGYTDGRVSVRHAGQTTYLAPGGLATAGFETHFETSPFPELADR